MSESSETLETDEEAKESRIQTRASVKRKKLECEDSGDDAPEFPHKKSPWLGAKEDELYPNLTEASAKIFIFSQRDAEVFTQDLLNPKLPNLGHRVVVFTDGSFLDDSRIGGAGIAFKLSSALSSPWIKSQSAILGIDCPDHAELVAITSAIRLACVEIQMNQFSIERGVSKLDPLREVYIITDSQISLTWIGDYLASAPDSPERRAAKFSHPSFSSLIYNLDCLSRHDVHVYFSWVKGHSGVHGNQEADKLARQAAQVIRRESWAVRDAEDGNYSVILLAELSFLVQPLREERKRKASPLDRDSSSSGKVATHRIGTRWQRRETRASTRKIGDLSVVDETTDTPIATSTEDAMVGTPENGPISERETTEGSA